MYQGGARGVWHDSWARIAVAGNRLLASILLDDQLDNSGGD